MKTGKRMGILLMAGIMTVAFCRMPLRVSADMDSDGTSLSATLDVMQETDEYWQAVALEAAVGTPTLTAKAAILMDASTGKVLFEQKADDCLPPASVTKIMTLLLVAEAIDRGELAFTDTVVASAEASQMGGSQIYLKENEEMTVDELLKATVVASANDAAYALAEYVGGSCEAFVEQMNRRATELGMTGTTFYNPTGLPAQGHVSTARDIALMSRELLKHTFIFDYTSIWMDYLRDGQTMLVNTNKLIRRYSGATGLKTGSTDEAGYCVSATAERDGLSLIAVVLGSPSGAERFDDAKQLLDYGYMRYCLTTPVLPEKVEDYPVENGKVTSVKVTVGKASPILLQKGEEEKLKVTVSEPVTLTAPVEQGQKVGEVTVSLDGEVLQTVPITAAEKVEKLTWWYLFSGILRNFLTV